MHILSLPPSLPPFLPPSLSMATAPFEVEGNWEVDGFYTKELGNKYQPNATIDEQYDY